jgi:hypothetical protein
LPASQVKQWLKSNSLLTTTTEQKKKKKPLDMIYVKVMGGGKLAERRGFPGGKVH